MPVTFAQIVELAAREGLRAAAALPLDRAGDSRLAAWLEEGRMGEMAWMAEQAGPRLDPADHFAPYRSVVSFLAPHADPGPQSDPRLGNIARYALGDDYHEVLKAKLFLVMDHLREIEPDLRLRALVDTAPLLEKVAAARAGIGWQGKHSNIIREGEGSWFFLAEMLIDRNLEAASPAVDRCGICDDCIRACPTGAIIRPYVVDARLCISYLTIELRGPIPRELRRHVGNRIFGCDDCQEVCPWNRHAKLDPILEFLPRDHLRDRSLTDWIETDVDEWRRLFRRSAVKRTKYRGFMRNVAVALGCSGDESVVPVIGSAWARHEPLVRAHLVWALRRLGGEQALATLAALTEGESDPLVLAELQGDPDAPLEAR